MSMDKNREIQITTPEERHGFVVLPYDQEQFKKFISSLLGSPQSISKTIWRPYEILAEDIGNLYQVITQRVVQQNNGVLARFSAKISHSDYSAVDLNSISELLTYAEIRPVVSEALHLTWDFVVQFPDKDTPEKQRIQVSFRAPIRNPEKYGLGSYDEVKSVDDDDDVDWVNYTFNYRRYEEAAISFRIEHTARTWGADIEALLMAYIGQVVKPISKSKRFVKKWRASISLFVAGVLFSLLSFSWVSRSDFYAHKVKQQVATVTQPDGQSIQDIDDKLSFFISYYFDPDRYRPEKNLASLIIIAFLAVMLAFALANAANNVEPSFILLTKESYKYKEKVLTKLQRKWLSFVLGCVLSIALGIVSNFIFSYIYSSK
jgi:hypothetical protein